MNLPPTISVGTTTAKTIHASACYWSNTLKFFGKHPQNFYANMQLVKNPDIDTQHGITPDTANVIANNPDAFMPSTLSFRNLSIRSQSMSSQLDITMDVDAPTSTSLPSFNWLPVDPQIVSSALPTERTVRSYMWSVYESALWMEEKYPALFRINTILKTYVLCIISMYAGFWPSSQSMRSSDVRSLLVARNVTTFAVTRMISRYVRHYTGKSI